MKQAYLDCSSGVSGDMFLAALLDAGLEPRRLLEELKKISLGFYEFKRTRAVRGTLVGTRVEVHVRGEQPRRKLADLEELIGKSTLSDSVKQRSLKIFGRLAEVEGKLHNQPPAEVHFHEVGAVDSIIDIVGACVGFDLLEISELVCSPLNVGGGSVQTEHGSLPVPAPATAELLKEIPVYSSGVEGELVTPTGAAIVSTLASSFGPMPAFKIQAIGYGAGEKDFPGVANVARLFLGRKTGGAKAEAGLPGEELVSVIEANLDDMSPQLYGYFVDQALAAGALDVTGSAVQMKKNRPGLQVTILTTPEKSDALSQLLFEQTTTIGLRIYEARRKVLEREEVSVETPYGPVRVKVAKHEGKAVNAAPEYEDCQKLANEKGVPLKQIILAAQAAHLQKKA
ncbi:MAG: nickel pincer cofactor biosynthesis protein LarC [Acidobacteria bacterium]|nr:nickel pincer cofactor biosynthesis protein LarC [Acidobacteriota bacterium]